MAALTGKRRFRRGYAYEHVEDHMILQVEYNKFITTQEGKPGRWVCEWRDAIPEDVTEEVV